LKILHIITGLQGGGAEAVLYRVCTYEPDCEHVVVSMLDQGKYGLLLSASGIETHYLNMRPGGISLYGIFKLFSILNQYKPDVIQTWMYHADLIGGIIARIAGIRAICWGVRHSDVHPVKTKLSTRLVVQLCAKVSTWLPTKIVCCAQKALQVHEQLGYPAEKCVVIPNGYDLNRFRPDDSARRRVRDELGIADNMPLLGMVARYDPQKDHANLVKALSLLKKQGIEFRCVLVGNGLTAANLELSELIDEFNLGDKMLLLGSRDDIPALMNGLDIHILSSSYGEAFPNVLAEAMACGTPCITTDVGDAALIVGDTGWVVPAQDEQELAKSLNESLGLLQDRVQWSVRQGHCRERIIENFSIEKTIQAYRKVWQDSQSLSY